MWQHIYQALGRFAESSAIEWPFGNVDSVAAFEQQQVFKARVLDAITVQQSKYPEAKYAFMELKNIVARL